MAIAPLHPAPLVAADDGVRQVLGVLDRCEGAGGLDAAAATRLISDVDRAVSRLQAMKLVAIAVVDKANIAAEKGMTGTAAWLAGHSRADSAAANRDVKLATALDDGLDVTQAALAKGDLSTDHARVIAKVAAQLPESVTPAERAQIETELVAKARILEPAKLGKVARRALEVVNRPPAEVDAHEDAMLRREEEAALDRTRLTMVDNRDGTVTGHFTVPTLAGHILRKVVQQIASPRRFALRAAEAARADGARSADEVASAAWEAFRSEDLTWAQKYGLAFVELLEHLPTERLSGKVAATVLVTLDHDKLRAQVGAAHLDTGHDLSATEVRRLACNAGIVPVVLGGQGQPLDLGRTERFFTEAQRVALATRYDTCAAEGCDRPFDWTEGHHEDAWSRGGRTDLDRAVPLCGFHHRRVHDPGYAHVIATDQSGRKRVTYSRRT